MASDMSFNKLCPSNTINTKLCTEIRIESYVTTDNDISYLTRTNYVFTTQINILNQIQKLEMGDIFTSCY